MWFIKDHATVSVESRVVMDQNLTTASTVSTSARAAWNLAGKNREWNLKLWSFYGRKHARVTRVNRLSVQRPDCTYRSCVSNCPLGHYEDRGSRRCRRCCKGCERCVGRSAGDCLACRRGLYLSPLNSSCVDICPPGYFADESKSEISLPFLHLSTQCTLTNTWLVAPL